MGNLLQYTDKSKAIDNKLNALLNSVKQDYENGLIRTQTEYYYRIKCVITEFYQSLNKPMFVYRPAVTTPISDEYNSMIKEAFDDMKYIVDDCLFLTSSIEQSYADAEVNRNMMSNQISYLKGQVEKIIKNVSSNKTNNSIIFSELFKEDKITYALKNCSIDTEGGILSLNPTKSVIAGISNIEISDESNGFPGNTHCVDTIGGEIHYLGQNGLHNKLKDICDDNNDTWFEYELISVPEEIKQNCGYYGFEYNEGVSWEGEGPLKLKLTFTLNTATPCTWIDLVPYLSDIKGVKASVIEKCDVITDDNNVYCIATNRIFDKHCILTFPSKPISKIILTLIQYTWYPTKIGHNYYTEINTKSMSIFENYNTNENFTRCDGDNPSIAYLNLTYDPSTQKAAPLTLQSTTISESYAKDNLFKMPSSDVYKQGNQEIINAYRYMIGIKNITIKSHEFVDSGTFVSGIYTTKEYINSVILESEEFIPGDDPEIIQYFVSFDSGLNWHKIYPTHRAYTGIYRYTINNDNIENLLTTENENVKSKNINMLQDVYQIQLKICLKKPSDTAQDIDSGVENRDYTTPIVYNYKLIINTGGDHIEY